MPASRRVVTTTPLPSALPAMLVPAPRIVSGVPVSPQMRTMVPSSSRSAGSATRLGSAR